MKQIYLGLIIISTILTSCNNNAKEKEVKKSDEILTYKSADLNFSMAYPNTFEAIEGIDDIIPVGFFKLKEDSAKSYRENLLLSIEDLPVKVPFEDYVMAGKTQLKIMMPGIKITDEDSMTVDGHKVATYQYPFTKKSVKFISKFYVIPMDKKAYQFNSTSLEASFDTQEKVFDDMIQSIKFN